MVVVPGRAFVWRTKILSKIHRRPRTCGCSGLEPYPDPSAKTTRRARLTRTANVRSCASNIYCTTFRCDNCSVVPTHQRVRDPAYCYSSAQLPTRVNRSKSRMIIASSVPEWRPSSGHATVGAGKLLFRPIGHGPQASSWRCLTSIEQTSSIPPRRMQLLMIFEQQQHLDGTACTSSGFSPCVRS